MSSPLMLTFKIKPLLTAEVEGPVYYSNSGAKASKWSHVIKKNSKKLKVSIQR